MDPQAASAAAAAAANAIKARLVSAGQLTTGQLSAVPAAPNMGPPRTSFAPAPAPEQLQLEIDINDNPQRMVLTRGPKQVELSSTYGVTVTTRGRYYPPMEKKRSSLEKPLHLFIEAKDQQALNRAKDAINAILAAAPAKPAYERRNISVKVWVDIYVPLGSPFDLRTKITGPDNSYFHHISTETGCKVFLRGRGSGTFEPASGNESHEQLHIFLEHSDRWAVNSAKQLCEDLVKTARVDFNAFTEEQNRRPPPTPYGQHPGTAYGAPPHSYYGQQPGYGQSGYGYAPHAPAYGAYGQYPPAAPAGQPGYPPAGGPGHQAYPSGPPPGQQAYPSGPPPGYQGYPAGPPPGHKAATATAGQATQQAQWGSAPPPGTYGPTAASVPPSAAPPLPPGETPGHVAGGHGAPPPPPNQPPPVPAEVPDLPPPAKRKFSEKRSYVEQQPPPAPSRPAAPVEDHVEAKPQPKKQKLQSLVDYDDD